MASLITVPTIYDYAIFNGNIDVLSPSPNVGDAYGGDGSVYVRTGNLYVGGITNLFATTIATSSTEPFYVNGTGEMNVGLTGANKGITMSSYFNSSFTVTGTGLSAGNGNLVLSAAGNNIGTVAITADGAVNNSININATNTAGQVHVQSSGTGTGSSAGVIVETTGVSGQTVIQSASTNAAAVRINASAGGINATATGIINIDTTSTALGINIGTVTAGVPINIGATSSLTTIGGDLVVRGTTTSVNTTTLTFLNNSLILNSGNNILGNDANIEIRRYQLASGAYSGSVISNLSTASIYTLGSYPIQESGVSRAGGVSSGTTQTIALASNSYVSANASDTYYKGWWIYIYAAPAGFTVPAIRRIKSYDGTTQIASIYNTSDNVSGATTQYTITSIPTAAANSNVTITLSATPTNFVNGMVVNLVSTNSTPTINGDYVITWVSGATFTLFTTVAITVAGTAGFVNVTPFNDGLNWLSAPPAGCSYYLYNQSYISTYYNESSGFYEFLSVPDGEEGIISTAVTQPQNLKSGEVDVVGKSYSNVFSYPVGNTLVLTIANHQLTSGMFVKLTAQTGFTTPPLTITGSPGNPYVITRLNSNQFSIPTVTPTVANPVITASTSTSFIVGTVTGPTNGIYTAPLTLTTVPGASFAVGMILTVNTGSSLATTAQILEFTTGSGAAGSVATITSNGLLTAGTYSNTLSGYSPQATTVNAYFYNTSILKANILTSFDPEFPISIPGASVYQDIIIPKTSTGDFLVSLTLSYGAYMLLVCDTNTSVFGSSAIFACANSTQGVNPSRVISSRGNENQRINAKWSAGSGIQIFQQPAGSGGGNYTYRVRVYSCL